ncbi:AAA family ATPase [Clostridiaceae bacterium 35-E11]
MKHNYKIREYNDILNLFEQGKISTEYVIKRLSENDNIPTIKEENLEVLMKELHRLIGLDSVKKLIQEIQAFIMIQEKRKSEGLVSTPIVLHMIFKGSPGTGKTTVARLLGRIFCEIGVLEKGHVIEVERADLVGEYIGHTAVKVRDHIKKSLGGIMFIDEAYSLARGGEKDFGKEAIDAMVKGMEDHKENLILILAGYRNEMDIFLQSNPGLKSRFPIHIDFPDYSLEELIAIAEVMVKERQYELSISAKARLSKILSQQRVGDKENSGNARLVRNIIERAIRKQAIRLQNCGSFSKEDLITLKREDITEEDHL